MSWPLVALVAAGIALPHALPLRRAHPGAAAVVWAAALGLRALAVVALALSVVVVVTGSDALAAASAWRLHDVVSFTGVHVDLTGHGLGHLASLVPTYALIASLGWVAVRLARAGRAARRLTGSRALGDGPGGSVVVGGAGIVVAAAGLRRPRLLLSAGALAMLDDHELGAGLAHERGHIARRHRWVLVYAELCRALGRGLPGTGAAARQLAFHLERDADRWALRRGHDRRALAGAICKAAMSGLRAQPAIIPLSGADVTDRVAELLEGGRRRGGRRSAAAIGALGGTLVALALAVSLALPGLVAAGIVHSHPGPAAAVAACRD